ncbi:hypothetical protein C8R43DRAFT_946845 [Mycena crocata]|nr:hypothetical protein C8R43DRAFT_946845 [Mycena crocata]
MSNFNRGKKGSPPLSLIVQLFKSSCTKKEYSQNPALLHTLPCRQLLGRSCGLERQKYQDTPDAFHVFALHLDDELNKIKILCKNNVQILEESPKDGEYELQVAISAGNVKVDRSRFDRIRVSIRHSSQVADLPSARFNSVMSNVTQCLSARLNSAEHAIRNNPSDALGAIRRERRTGFSTRDTENRAATTRKLRRVGINGVLKMRHTPDFCHQLEAPTARTRFVMIPMSHTTCAEGIRAAEADGRRGLRETRFRSCCRWRHDELGAPGARQMRLGDANLYGRHMDRAPGARSTNFPVSKVVERAEPRATSSVSSGECAIQERADAVHIDLKGKIKHKLEQRQILQVGVEPRSRVNMPAFGAVSPNREKKALDVGRARFSIIAGPDESSCGKPACGNAGVGGGSWKNKEKDGMQIIHVPTGATMRIVKVFAALTRDGVQACERADMLVRELRTRDCVASS